MKVQNYFMLRGIIAFILGLLLVIWPDVAINYLVITVGVVFFAAGLATLISYFARRSKAKERKENFPLEGAGSVLFGFILIIIPSFFINILMSVLGLILVLGGIHQIVSLISARKRTIVPLSFYIVPVLVLIAGIVVIINPFTVASGALMLLGITSIIYGIAELVNGFKFKKMIEEEIV